MAVEHLRRDLYMAGVFLHPNGPIKDRIHHVRYHKRVYEFTIQPVSHCSLDPAETTSRAPSKWGRKPGEGNKGDLWESIFFTYFTLLRGFLHLSILLVWCRGANTSQVIYSPVEGPSWGEGFGWEVGGVVCLLFRAQWSAEHNDPEKAGPPGARSPPASAHPPPRKQRERQTFYPLPYCFSLNPPFHTHPLTHSSSLLFTPSHRTIQGSVTKSQ